MRFEGHVLYLEEDPLEGILVSPSQLEGREFESQTIGEFCIEVFGPTPQESYLFRAYQRERLVIDQLVKVEDIGEDAALFQLTFPQSQLREERPILFLATRRDTRLGLQSSLWVLHELSSGILDEIEEWLDYNLLGVTDISDFELNGLEGNSVPPRGLLPSWERWRLPTAVQGPDGRWILRERRDEPSDRGRSMPPSPSWIVEKPLDREVEIGWEGRRHPAFPSPACWCDQIFWSVRFSADHDAIPEESDILPATFPAVDPNARLTARVLRHIQAVKDQLPRLAHSGWTALHLDFGSEVKFELPVASGWPIHLVPIVYQFRTGVALEEFVKAAHSHGLFVVLSMTLPASGLSNEIDVVEGPASFADVCGALIESLDLDGFRLDVSRVESREELRIFCETIHSKARALGKDDFLLSASFAGAGDQSYGYMEETGLNAILNPKDAPDRPSLLARGQSNPSWLDKSGLGGGNLRKEGLYEIHVTAEHDATCQVEDKFRDSEWKVCQVVVALSLLGSGIPWFEFEAFPSSVRQLHESQIDDPFGKDWVHSTFFWEICQLRKEHVALRRGRQFLRELSQTGRDDNFCIPRLIGGKLEHVVAWSRIHDETEILVAINTNPHVPITTLATLDSRLHLPGSSLAYLYSTEEAQVDAESLIYPFNGCSAEITVPPLGVVVLGSRAASGSARRWMDPGAVMPRELLAGDSPESSKLAYL